MYHCNNYKGGKFEKESICHFNRKQWLKGISSNSFGSRLSMGLKGLLRLEYGIYTTVFRYSLEDVCYWWSCLHLQVMHVESVNQNIH